MGIYPGDYGGDKHHLNNIAQYALQTYRNTVGDDATPDIPYWNVQTNSPMQSKIMVFMVWACWIYNSFLLMLILLNFLIAVLCESFDTVQNEAIQYEYKAKSEMNVDTMLIQKVMGRLAPFEAVILSCQESNERSSNPLDKAVESIKQSQNEMKEKMIKGVGVETGKQLESFTTRVKGETKSIKTLIKNEIEGEKETLWDCMNDITRAVENTKRKITSGLHGTRDQLVEDNNKIHRSVT